MKYNLEISLQTGSTNDCMNLIVLDRHKNILPTEITKQADLISLKLEITMPNKIFFYITGKDYSKHNDNVFFKVRSMSLGGIRINNKKIDDLFEYKSDQGLVSDPSLKLEDYLEFDTIKTSLWNRNGCAILELFDIDPIRYHLHIETQALATI